MSINENEQPLDSRVKVLQSELSQYLRKTRRRSSRMTVLLALLVVVLIAYLSFIYTRLSDVNAETAAELAYRRTLQYVQASPPVISKALKDRAPEVFDLAEAKMLETPAAVAQHIRRSALEKTQIVLDHSEPRIKQVLTEAVAHAKASMARAGVDANDPAQLNRMMEQMADEVRTQLTVELGRLNEQYEQQAASLLSYLDKLATGQDLDQRQLHLRNVIISFLAVAEKHKQQH